MTAATPAERQRRHRARVRSARGQAWAAEFPAVWGPFLGAWADRGLRHPPTAGQLALLAPYAELPRGGLQLGAALGRVRRARARHSPTTYRLVAAVVRTMELIRNLATNAKHAFSRPLDLSDPTARRERGEGTDAAERAPPRSSRKRAAGQRSTGHAGSLADALRRATDDPDVQRTIDELERGTHGEPSDTAESR